MSAVYLPWGVHLLDKWKSTSPEKIKAKLQNDNKFGEKVYDLLFHMSTREVEWQKSFKAEDLTALLKNFSDAGLFSNQNYLIRNGFRFLQLVEQSCLKKEWSLASKWVIAGARPSLKAFEFALNSPDEKAKEFINVAYSTLTPLDKRTLFVKACGSSSAGELVVKLFQDLKYFPFQEELDAVLSLKDPLTVLNLLEADFPYNFVSSKGSTFTHLAARLHSPALATWLDNHESLHVDAKSFHYMTSFVVDNAENARQWLQLFSILFHRCKQKSALYTDLPDLSAIIKSAGKAISLLPAEEQPEAQKNFRVFTSNIQKMGNDALALLINNSSKDSCSLLTLAIYWNFEDLALDLLNLPIANAKTLALSLFFSIQKGSKKIFHAILKKISPLDQIHRSNFLKSRRSSQGEETFLLYAAFFGEKEFVESLIEQGASLTDKDKMGCPFLSYLVRGNLISMAEEYANKNAHLESLQRSNQDETGLICCKEGRLDATCFWVSKGGNLSARDAEGRTILHHAVNHSRKKGFIELISHILKLPQGKEIINIRDKEGMTALDIACKMENYETATLLANSGASLRCDENEKSPKVALIFSIPHGDLFDYLLSKSEKTELSLCLKHAAEINRVDILKKILSKVEGKEAHFVSLSHAVEIAFEKGIIDSYQFLLPYSRNWFNVSEAYRSLPKLKPKWDQPFWELIWEDLPKGIESDIDLAFIHAIKTNDTALISFFLRKCVPLFQFSNTNPFPSLSQLQGEHRLLKEGIVKNIEPRLSSLTTCNFSSLFNEEIGDQILWAKMGGEESSYKVFRSLLQSRAQPLMDLIKTRDNGDWEIDLTPFLEKMKLELTQGLNGFKALLHMIYASNKKKDSLLNQLQISVVIENKRIGKVNRTNLCILDNFKVLAVLVNRVGLEDLKQHLGNLFPPYAWSYWKEKYLLSEKPVKRKIEEDGSQMKKAKTDT